MKFRATALTMTTARRAVAPAGTLTRISQMDYQIDDLFG